MYYEEVECRVKSLFIASDCLFLVTLNQMLIKTMITNRTRGWGTVSGAACKEKDCYVFRVVILI
jgi:hypothetical protein